MIQEFPTDYDRPAHFETETNTPIAGATEGSVADAALLERLRKAGWEITGDSAKNPETGTTITVGDILTPTQAKEAQAALATAGPAPAPAPGGSSGAPAADPAPPPGDGAQPTSGEKFSKGAEVDQSFLDQAKAKGWDVVGDTATAPNGTKYKLGENMTFQQARTANEAGLTDTTAA